MGYQNCDQRCNAKWVHVSYRIPSLYARLHLFLHCSSQMPNQKPRKKSLNKFILFTNKRRSNEQNPEKESNRKPWKSSKNGRLKKRKKEREKERELTAMAILTASFCMSSFMSALLMTTFLAGKIVDSAVSAGEGFRSSVAGFTVRAPLMLLFASSVLIFFGGRGGGFLKKIKIPEPDKGRKREKQKRKKTEISV